MDNPLKKFGLGQYLEKKYDYVKGKMHSFTVEGFFNLKS